MDEDNRNAHGGQSPRRRTGRLQSFDCIEVLKNGRAKAIRFSTLTALCDALDCQPGDLLEVSDRTGSRT
jgi:Cro/C1-type HTH DNA-binding domain